jgi:hypothetical protein
MGRVKIRWREWLPFRPWRVIAQVEAADEIPERLPLKGAVIVGTPRQPKWLAFDCACFQGHRIMVSLEPSHEPHWEVTSQARLTLFPSVDFRSPGQRCHYIIRDGKVSWVHRVRRVSNERK